MCSHTTKTAMFAPLICVVGLLGCSTNVVHKTALKQLPLEQNVIIKENYKQVSLCVKEYEMVEDYSCQFCDLSRGFNGTTIEPRNLTIFNELGYAEIALGFENYLWILMEFKKIDASTTSLDIYAVKEVEETGRKFLEAAKSCGKP